MCGICGCAEEKHEHHHDHGQEHEHLIHIEQDIMAQNRHFALHNQVFLAKKHILAVNLMSSPGSGKTTLLVKTIADLKNEQEMAVLVGDQQTHYDADMIESSGGRAFQLNTGRVCHLDAHRVGHAIEEMDVAENSLLFIENIGNLVCPAMFDLGEQYKVVILSVTEGDNKPLKYPDMFHCADVVIITKIDLLPYVDFDIERCMEYAQRINPGVKCMTLSAKTGEGIELWYDWLRQVKA